MWKRLYVLDNARWQYESRASALLHTTHLVDVALCKCEETSTPSSGVELNWTVTHPASGALHHFHFHYYWPEWDLLSFRVSCFWLDIGLELYIASMLLCTTTTISFAVYFSYIILNIKNAKPPAPLHFFIIELPAANESMLLLIRDNNGQQTISCLGGITTYVFDKVKGLLVSNSYHNTPHFLDSSFIVA